MGTEHINKYKDTHKKSIMRILNTTTRNIHDRVSIADINRFDRRDEPWKGQKGLYSKRWKRLKKKISAKSAKSAKSANSAKSIKLK